MPQLKTSQVDIVLRSHRALEMIMRSTLDGLQDAACISAFNPYSDCVQILSISPPSSDDQSVESITASIHSLQHHRTNSVLDYLLERESRSNQLVI